MEDWTGGRHADERYMFTCLHITDSCPSNLCLLDINQEIQLYFNFLKHLISYTSKNYLKNAIIMCQSADSHCSGQTPPLIRCSALIGWFLWPDQTPYFYYYDLKL